jgi:hypothetical protein
VDPKGARPGGSRGVSELFEAALVDGFLESFLAGNLP